MNSEFLLLMSMVLVMAAASSSLTACDRRNVPTPTAWSSSTTDTVLAADKAAVNQTAAPASPLGNTGGTGGVGNAGASERSASSYAKPAYGASAAMAPGSDGINKPVVHGGVDQPPIVVPPAPNTMPSTSAAVSGSAANGANGAINGTSVAAAPEALLNGAPPAAGQISPQAPSALSLEEQSFIKTALDAALAELRLSQLAAERASNSIVKSYAALLISDQSALVDRLQRLAQQRGLPALLTLTEDRQRALEGLSRSASDRFDQAYLRASGSVQNQALISLFEQADREARDPAVRALVQSALPALKAHLSASEQMPLLG